MSVKQISREELEALVLSGGEYILINVLDREQFDSGHIPTSINIPLDSGDFDGRIRKAAPKKNSKILVYCTNYCETSVRGAKRIVAMGYTDVSRYEGGMKDWEEANLPIEKS